MLRLNSLANVPSVSREAGEAIELELLRVQVLSLTEWIIDEMPNILRVREC
jgi:hypothetical protein